MTRNFFGTDGIRGTANVSPMDATTALKVGMAAGKYFTRGQHRHRVVIGKDTRLSGYMVETALTSGFVSMGMDVILVGPMPTPAISMITRSLRADLGVMISASHNKYEDNGIKLFDQKGLKLSDKVESELEKLMNSDLTSSLAKSSKLGRAKRLDDAAGRYVEYVKQTFPKNKRLDGLKIVVDCANGAGYQLAPTILWELGAEVIAISVAPNGFNINDNCGSTHPEKMCKKVREEKADIGIALDGDADRVVICDEKGNIIDGDQLIGAIATYWKERGTLKGDGVVTTVMSNLGLEKYLEKIGLKLERTKVGDRYVTEKMVADGYNLGGEQSGHIVFNDYTTTGDGLVAALQALAIMVEKNQPASKVLKVFKPLPQVLKNVEYNNKKKDPLERDSVKEAIRAGEDALGKSGRVFIRKSGTEPLIRVMTESSDSKLAEKVATSITKAIKNA